MNEHRGALLDFDARSMFDAPASASVAHRIEMGFVGSHSDIGGSYGKGDLSDVALMWMVAQAQAQGIALNTKKIEDNEWNKVTNPILHDKSSNKDHPGEIFEDRYFVYGEGTEVRQYKAVIGGYDTKWTKSMINYLTGWCDSISAPAVGLVKADEYAAWAQAQGIQVTFDVPADLDPCKK